MGRGWCAQCCEVRNDVTAHMWAWTKQWSPTFLVPGTGAPMKI